MSASRKKIEEIVRRLGSLDEEQYLDVLDQILEIIRSSSRDKKQVSLLDLRGVGQELWKQIDVDRHLKEQRDSWD